MRLVKAYIDDDGFNVDRSCTQPWRRARTARMVDVETRMFRILVRFIRRRHPPLVWVMVFFNPDHGCTVFRVGRKKSWLGW